MDAGQIAMVAGAAFAGGAINAIAGGGSLVTFPTLVAVGLPPVLASVTNTVALCPGYLGATIAQRGLIKPQRRRLALLVPAGAVGGALGAYLLLHTSARAFDVIVPFLILVAALLVGAQDWLRRRLLARVAAHRAEALAMLTVGAAAIYGGYFGAGLGVMILAALGAIIGDELPRLNALKQAVSLSVNVTAALAFVIWAHDSVDWTITAIMAGAALAGGAAGGALASRIPARALRVLIVIFGVSVAGVYFTRL
ncbi:MAG: sulfite exporter TauE/SafE family protein [Myxococcales bacterium]|nr:sulfite exporter TauE/SafE family protein [Myxococcales bacterium]